jgi:hypothetical protein
MLKNLRISRKINRLHRRHFLDAAPLLGVQASACWRLKAHHSTTLHFISDSFVKELRQAMATPYGAQIVNLPRGLRVGVANPKCLDSPPARHCRIPPAKIKSTNTKIRITHETSSTA